MSDPNALWERLLAAVRRRGLDLDRLATPGDVADEAEAVLGDVRVREFVWGYYYPRRFGDTDGELTADEASALVEAVAGGEPCAPVRPEPGKPCPICGRDRPDDRGR